MIIKLQQKRKLEFNWQRQSRKKKTSEVQRNICSITLKI